MELIHGMDHKLDLSSVVWQQEQLVARERRLHGCSQLFSFLLSMHSEKGGDISRLISWRTMNHTKGRTVWRYSAMRAAEQHAVEALALMIRSNPDLASKPCMSGGQASPLHLGAYFGLPRVVALLLSHGAKADVKTHGGRTPLDEAMYNGNHEALSLLLAALPNRQQALERRRIAEYAALPDASLRLEGLDGLRLPYVPKRRARVDPRPPEWGAPSCAVGGGWSSAAQPPPTGSPLAKPGGMESFDASMIDQRAGLSEEEYYREYFLKGRPVLIRNAVSLAERCALAATSSPMRQAVKGLSFTCGATAYPELTGRRTCGRFGFLDLISSPRCHDANRTRPVCNWKLGRMKGKHVGDWNRQGVDLAAGFREMPKRLRHPPDLPPVRMMRRAWSVSTSRALWGGTAWSGSGFHYHNPAYNVLFFGQKKWMITPPRFAGISDLDSIDWPDAPSQARLPQGLPLRFTQRAGDLVIVPPQWGHSTLSDGGFTLGLGVLWCDQRWINVSAGQCHLSGSTWDKARALDLTPTRTSGVRTVGSSAE